MSKLTVGIKIMPLEAVGFPFSVVRTENGTPLVLIPGIDDASQKIAARIARLLNSDLEADKSHA